MRRLFTTDEVDDIIARYTSGESVATLAEKYDVCGTPRGVWKHQRDGEKACPACVEARRSEPRSGDKRPAQRRTLAPVHPDPHRQIPRRGQCRRRPRERRSQAGKADAASRLAHCGEASRVNREAKRKRLAYLKKLSREISSEMILLEADLMRVTESGKRSRKVIPPCGTESAYQRHHHLGEERDEACLRAHSIWVKAAQLRRLRRERGGAA